MGSIQYMVFQDFDEGPYYLPPNLQQIRKHDEVRGKKVKNRLKKDLSEDIEKFGISSRGKTLKEKLHLHKTFHSPLRRMMLLKVGLGSQKDCGKFCGNEVCWILRYNMLRR